MAYQDSVDVVANAQDEPVQGFVLSVPQHADAIVKGEKFSSVLEGLLQDITRILARKVITEPLGNAVSAGLSGMGAGSWTPPETPSSR